MKKIITYSIIGFLSLGMVSFSSKETPKEILIKLNKAYENKAYQMNYEVSSSNANSSEVIQSYKGMVAKSGEEHFNESLGNITILNSKYFLHVDNYQKVIYLNDKTKENSKKNKESELLSWLESSLNKLDMKYVSALNGNHIIEIKLEGQVYEKALIYVDSKTYFLKKVSYFLAKKEYDFNNITITYSNIKMGKKVNQKLFSVKPFIKKGLKTTLRKKYKKYQFVDQRKLKTN